MHRCPDPGSGHRGFLWGEGGITILPSPARLQPAEQGIPEGQPPLAATESGRGRGAGPRTGRKQATDSAPAHQGGSGAHGGAARSPEGWAGGGEGRLALDP